MARSCEHASKTLGPIRGQLLAFKKLPHGVSISDIRACYMYFPRSYARRDESSSFSHKEKDRPQRGQPVQRTKQTVFTPILNEQQPKFDSKLCQCRRQTWRRLALYCSGDEMGKPGQ